MLLFPGQLRAELRFCSIEAHVWLVTEASVFQVNVAGKSSKNVRIYGDCCLRLVEAVNTLNCPQPYWMSKHVSIVTTKLLDSFPCFMVHSTCKMQRAHLTYHAGHLAYVTSLLQTPDNSAVASLRSLFVSFPQPAYSIRKTPLVMSPQSSLDKGDPLLTRSSTTQVSPTSWCHTRAITPQTTPYPITASSDE